MTATLDVGVDRIWQRDFAFAESVTIGARDEKRFAVDDKVNAS
jgi:hypothetical protein